ncbi:glycosyltransferase [Leifsonia sp. EB34]|uniref:glycosyltransferase n=1 Tax=Leifsonia sp. EB34 TaxID=3156303 RepID=UPI0035117667
MTATRTAHHDVRLYEVVRSAHLERAHDFEPATIIYRDRRYDYDPSLEPGLDLTQAGDLTAARIIARSHVATLEVNEPLMLSAARRTALSVAAVRMLDLLRGSHTSIVSYAIENLEPPLPAGTRGRLGRWGRMRLARYVHRNIDRLAFGTDASWDLYHDIFAPGRRQSTRIIPALPAPAEGAATGPREAVVGFLGAFDERKGLRELLAAWPLVRAARPSARLVLLGKGPLQELAEEAAADDPSIELTVDPPRSAIPDALRSIKALALPSQPRARWREQVGLPIVEGLANGCVIVTTRESGLSSWLETEGHHVVPSVSGAETLAAALIAALDDPRTPEDVLHSLPPVDGRRAADQWLFERATA